MCGSKCGPSMIWDFATATPTLAPHMALGGAHVCSMCWNSCFHAVVICSFSPYAPIRVLCYDPDQPQIVLTPLQQGSAAAAATKQKWPQVRIRDMCVAYE